MRISKVASSECVKLISSLLKNVEQFRLKYLIRQIIISSNNKITTQIFSFSTSKNTTQHEGLQYENHNFKNIKIFFLKKSARFFSKGFKDKQLIFQSKKTIFSKKKKKVHRDYLSFFPRHKECFHSGQAQLQLLRLLLKRKKKN